MLLYNSVLFLLFKLRTEHVEQVVNRFFFEVGLFDQHFAWSVEHGLSGLQTDGLDGVDDPLVYLVRELVEVDVLVVAV